MFKNVAITITKRKLAYEKHYSEFVENGTGVNMLSHLTIVEYKSPHHVQYHSCFMFTQFIQSKLGPDWQSCCY